MGKGNREAKKKGTKGKGGGGIKIGEKGKTLLFQ